LYVERNVNATRGILEAAFHSGVRRFVHASSSSVYGPAPGRPVREDDQLRPASPYALSKLAAEHLVEAYAEKGLAATVLRYFTVYGPRQRPDMAISRFISLARERKELEVLGDGSQVREFTYVADAADATVRALFSGDSFDTYNVGGGGRASVRRLVGLVSDALGMKVGVCYLPEAQGDVPSTWADCEKAKRELGYSPSTDLERGILAQAGCLATREALGA
jgi:nucleoside-diphosphate-sugar epimerase